MKITKHALERFHERAVYDFVDSNPTYRNKQILKDINKNLKFMYASSQGGSILINGNYCRYILRNDTVITVFKKKKYMTKQEKRKWNKKYKFYLIEKGENRKNIKSLFDFKTLTS